MAGVVESSALRPEHESFSVQTFSNARVLTQILLRAVRPLPNTLKNVFLRLWRHLKCWIRQGSRPRFQILEVEDVV